MRHHILTILRLLRRRALTIVIFGALFAIIGNQGYTLVDKYHYSHAADSSFIDYYSFDVNNARSGEDVYFQVCRKHDQNYQYTGNLSVSIINTASDPKAVSSTKVYSRQLGGTLNPGECENKVLRASDFDHQPGSYVMRFNIEIHVKYGFVKRGFKESNIYTIYPQPTDVQDQIKYYQLQIDNLNSQLRTQSSTTGDTNPSSLAVPSTDTASPTAGAPVGSDQGTAPPSNNGDQTITPANKTCVDLPLLPKICL